MVAPVAVMAPASVGLVLAMEVTSEEVLAAPEVWEEATAAGSTAASNSVSSPLHGKQREDYRRRDCISCE